MHRLFNIPGHKFTILLHFHLFFLESTAFGIGFYTSQSQINRTSDDIKAVPRCTKVSPKQGLIMVTRGKVQTRNLDLKWESRCFDLHTKTIIWAGKNIREERS